MHQFAARALGVLFALAGCSKLLGWRLPLERLAQWHLPGWWMVYALGILQLAGGIGLWWAGSRRPSALLLAGVTLVILSAQVRFGLWWDALMGVAVIALLLRLVERGAMRDAPGS